MHRKLFALILGTAAAVLVTAVPAYAQTQPGTGLAVSPPSYELSANPGDTLTNSIRVDNTQAQSLDVTVEVRNFTALGEQGEINLTQQDSNYSLAKWITVTPATVTIPAGQSQIFQYSIAVPANAEPGGHFGSIIFKTTAKPLAGQSGVSIGQEVGSLIFLKVAGAITEKASIASFTTSATINQYKPVNFTLRLKNTGNVHLKPTGTITISNTFGQKVANIPLDSHNVLPGAIRQMDAQWSGGKFIFGKYTATASIDYGDSKQILTATTVFWGLPYTLLLVCLGVLILLSIVIYRGRRRLRLALRALRGKE